MVEAIGGTAVPHPMIDEIKSIRDCQDSLDAGRYDEAQVLLQTPAGAYPFLTQKKNDLLLTCLYRKKNTGNMSTGSIRVDRTTVNSEYSGSIVFGISAGRTKRWRNSGNRSPYKDFRRFAT